MEMTTDDYMNMGIKAVATSPSDLIDHMNKIKNNKVALNKYISKLIGYFHKHMADRENNSDAISMYLDDYFDDLQIFNIKSTLKKGSKHTKLLHKLLKDGCSWAYISMNTLKITAFSYNTIVDLLWTLDEKQEALEELNG